MPRSPASRLIVALDVPSVDEAVALVERLGPAVDFYKIGLELAFVGGIALAERLIGEGRQVFLDLKLHDIPNTVSRTTAQIGRIGASFLTVHAFPQTMQAALDGLEGSDLAILGVTVLTSMGAADIEDAGYAESAPDLVARRARQAKALGIPGLVLSPQELVDVRSIVGPGMLLVTPGIRPAGTDRGDQKRTMTPAAAIRAGADHLVVGRPITAAADPREAAEAIQAEIQAAE